MLRIIIQDGLFRSQCELLSMEGHAQKALVRLIPY